MKRIIQICSLFGSLVLFSSVSANAQSYVGSGVEIPFAFTVGDKSYSPGQFVVRVAKLPSGFTTLSIQDTESDEIQTVFLSASGDQTTREIKLVFEVVEGHRILNKVTGPNQSYAVWKSKNRQNAPLSKLQ